MSYSYRVFNSIGEVDLTAWERVRTESGGSIFMDPRFIAAVEAGMKPSCQFWYVILYDQRGCPTACAGLTSMTIDLADLADPRLAWIIRHLPKELPVFRKFKLFMCGLPGSPGEKSLALTSADASSQLLSVLDGVISDLAAKSRTHAIVYKEFGKDDLQWTNPLLDLGYRRISTPPMHFFKPSFQDFAHYCAALRSRYRGHINRSIRKLKHPGFGRLVLTDPREILRVYTSEVHALYCQMVAKSEVKLEVLPIEFFRQLTLRSKSDVELVGISKDSRIVAFGWCLHVGSSYHMLCGGVDYQLNEEFDLYFNLMYALLDRALQQRVAKIHVGQTANAFKARMGCYSEPLYVFVKGRGPSISFLVRAAGNSLIAREPDIPSFDVFRNKVVEN